MYERIKCRELDYLDHYSRDLNSLMRLMVHPDPAARPTAAKLLTNPLLNPTMAKSRYAVYHYFVKIITSVAEPEPPRMDGFSQNY